MKVSVKKFLFGLMMTVAAFSALVTLQPAQVQASSCVDGKERGDFKGEWLSKDTVNVKTRSGGKLCKDVTIYVSSYTMPDNFNGGEFFGNPTAIPQHKYATKTVVLKAGTDGNTTTTIAVPDECTNYQSDAYLGPEVTVVGADGHMGRTIKAQIVQKTKSDCTPPPPEKVTTCNTTTKEIVKVEKGQENVAPYSTDLSKCKVTTCNTETKEIIKVDKGQENVAPNSTDLSKCKIETCNTETKQIVKVEKGQENVAPYSTDLSKCRMVDVCDTTTGKIVRVTESESKNSQYAAVNSPKCENQKLVCDTNTGKLISVPKSEAGNYAEVNSDACKEKVPTPEVLPSTGPMSALLSVLPLSAISGATAYYIRSRR